MKLPRFKKPPKGSLPAMLAAAGVVLGLAGWALQAAAAADMAAALTTQKKEAPEGGGSSPSLKDYRDVVTTIEGSIRIRQSIDSVLGQIEEQISALVESQAESRRVVEEANRSLSSIGRRLDSSVKSATRGVDRLAALHERLRRTYVLARLIAEELEELDESMGPSGGRP